jgi:hypothetical protein
MKNTYRTTGHDVHHPVSKVIKPRNDAPPGRIGVYNTKGQRRGHVGEHAGIGVVSKLLGGAPAEIGRVKNRPAWIATGASRTSAVTRAAEQLRKQIRTDRGSAKRK